MAYSDFNIKTVQSDFGLEIIEKLGIFANIPSSQISEYFAVTLEENIPLAVAINTEKAKSELIISNVLIEVRKKFDRKISFFSGIEFNIDKNRGLNGYCDFLISLSTEQLFLKSPVIAVVEGKNENIMGGLGQCIAEMIAAQIFNATEGNNISAIYGAITTGIFWKFLKLKNNVVYIDLRDYGIVDNPGKIIGIVSAMLQQEA
ncbi:hypothetical protein TI05_13350 [Achromatium sp. WMS3]|nr:hypothetical protein TI05_13350 [Achromatium sp. WMS3]